MKNPAPNFKDRALVIVFGILLLFSALLVFMKIETDKRTAFTSKGPEIEVSQLGQYPTPVEYQKGVPQEASSPHKEAGRILVVNDPGVIKTFAYNTEIPFREEIGQQLEEVLVEMGYTLTIYNRASLTNEFTLPNSQASPGAFVKGCTKYGFRWNAESGVIEVFFLVDRPTEDCGSDQFIVPVVQAIGMAKGEIFDWWKEGQDEIAKSQGRKPGASDYPLGVEF